MKLFRIEIPATHAENDVRDFDRYNLDLFNTVVSCNNQAACANVTSEMHLAVAPPPALGAANVRYGKVQPNQVQDIF